VPADQESRDDEEDVDPDEASAEHRHTRMIDEDERHGHRSETLDVGAEGPTAKGSGRPLGLNDSP
jgi:hypothetical protein